MTDSTSSVQDTRRAILVTGATGFIGRALITELQRDGQSVMALSRDVGAAARRLPVGVRVISQLGDIASDAAIDAVVHLAGARVLGHPWTESRRRELISSRVDLTGALLTLMQRLKRPPRVLVAASAVGFYGASPGQSFEVKDEGSPPRPGEFQSDLCVAIEDAARRAEDLGVRVVRSRFGIVLGRHGGAYPMQALAARLGAGAVLGTGNQPVPWIHLEDAVALIRFALADQSLQGALNAMAPDTRKQSDFVYALAASFGRGVHLRAPASLLRMAMGEMADLLLEGQNAVPAAATRAGYAFIHPSLDEALRELAQPARH